MRQISDLNKEDKLLELILDMQTKQSMGQIMGLQDPMYVSDEEVKDLLEDVIDNIWYISQSPGFEFERKFLPSDSIVIGSKKDMNLLFNKYKNKVFVWYNLTHSNNQSPNHYIIRGEFVDNRQHLREEKINQILEE